ncbi:MAG: cation-translocating P-type ATPase [Proteobacteria bacterium]|nr:cation-translocating P-type ATPase [Pseudomonadota bacterium]
MNRSDPKATRGLSTADAERRLREVGPNEIARGQAASPWRLLLTQFSSPVIWLLFGACVVSAALSEITDAIAIGAIVIINGLVGFFQEYRAERAVLALRSMTAPRARVIRDGHTVELPAVQVVPGDVLVLEAGDVVAADARLIEAHTLSTVEAALTGESMPTEKSVQPSLANAPLAERSDQVFLGTSVATGSGSAEVIATGMKTELGRIAHLLATAQEEVTPLQKRLASLSRVLLFLCLGIVAAVALLGWMRGLPAIEILLSAVSLAVAAVPEGLPAVVTIALAIGVQRMAARRALVRHMVAVETLGCATVICTDKTGTLTTGVMTVRELWGNDEALLLRVAAACSDADLAEDELGGVGDPTEIAILIAAAARGIRRSVIESERPRKSVHPFDADRKRMSIFRADDVLYSKGAVESIMQCSREVPEGTLEANAEMAARGLRVLAVARGSNDAEEGLELLGLIGIADPPRVEVIDAIVRAASAGIRTVMITGDHPVTAHAIARELGIVRDGESPDELVHARATPEDKLQIVRRWKSRGAIVAMTGDGVNDAPALREAHIGIAMGRTGTEVTREASDIVLADDNFATIINAVEEGRGIFDNIRKTVVYLLSGNAAELAVMFAAALIGLPLPLLPLHLLWINLVTDGFPALALVTDPTDANAMKRPPRHPQESILGQKEWRTVIFTGSLQAAVTLATFVWALNERNLDEARNLAFSVLVFGELLRAFSARDAFRPLWEVGLFSNWRLLAVVAVSFVVQIGIHHYPATQKLFQIGPLNFSDCMLSIAIGAVPLVVLEITKVMNRHMRMHHRSGV